MTSRSRRLRISISQAYYDQLEGQANRDGLTVNVEAYLALMSGIRAQAERWHRFDEAEKVKDLTLRTLRTRQSAAPRPDTWGSGFDELEESHSYAERGRREISQTTADPEEPPHAKVDTDLTP